MNWRVWGKLLLGVVISTGALFGAYYFFTSSLFRIHRIEFKSEAGLGSLVLFEQIQETLELRLSHLNEKFIWQVDLEKILKQIEGDQRIKLAKVHRKFPNEIIVSLTPHMPIGVVLTDGGKAFVPISRDSQLLPRITRIEEVDMPILRGSEFLKNEKLRKLAVDLLMTLPESGLLSQSGVSELHYDKVHGLRLILTDAGIELWMGEDDFARRVKQAERVLDYMKQEELSGKIIDARLTKKVVVKLR